jgi:N-acetylmuramoyl-L-alanine amidase
VAGGSLRSLRSTVALLRLLLLALLLAVAAQPAFAAGPANWSVSSGHFYTEAGGAPNVGYIVSNADGIPFLDELKRRGGPNGLGYPISRRFEWKGFTVQAFQKAVLQWQPAEKRVFYLNVFDDLAQAGRDEWLKTVRSTPGQIWLVGEDKMKWEEIVKGRLALLDANPAIKARYFSAQDPITLYGLPASYVQDMGNHFAIRLQRAVIQQWKVDVPWGKAGEVTVANGGDIMKESGLLPFDALGPLNPDGTNAAIMLPTPTATVAPLTGQATPTPAPPTGATPASGSPTPAPTATPPPLPAAPPAFREAPIKQLPPPGAAKRIVLDPGHGGNQVGSSATVADGKRILEKDLNLDIARRTAALLRAAGYQVTLTRDADAQVGGPQLKDDLQARIDVANGAKADAFVSIHHNGIGNTAIRGIESYFATDRPFSDDSKRLATLLYEQIGRQMAATGYDAYPRGTRSDSLAVGPGDHFFVLSPVNKNVRRATNMPGALVEALFLTNPQDAAQLGRNEVRDAIARGYAAAIATFLVGRTPQA